MGRCRKAYRRISRLFAADSVEFAFYGLLRKTGERKKKMEDVSEWLIFTTNPVIPSTNTC